jgi:hypothetical protein
MDDGTNASNPGMDMRLGGKSWTAYVRPVVTSAVLLLVLVPLASMAAMTAGVVAFLVLAAFLAYQCLLLRSFYLYIDDLGVWVFSGILPWNKGIAGVKWRDLDEAVYVQSMTSWLFKSYTIRIGHRYTKTSEILLDHWVQGDQAVLAINIQHAELVRANALA